MNKIEISREKLSLEVEITEHMKRCLDLKDQLHQAKENHFNSIERYNLLKSDPVNYFDRKKSDKDHQEFFDRKWQNFLNKDNQIVIRKECSNG